MDIALVIDRLVPEAQFTQSGTYVKLVATWTDARTVPTEAAINAEWSVYQTEQADTNYIRDREAEYPPITEQLEVIYSALKALRDGGTSFPRVVTTWLDGIATTKTKYPSS